MGAKELLERLSKDKELPNMFAGTDIRLSSHVPYGVPTGIPQLDLSLGRPGYPAGRNIELYGFEMSGKAEWIENRICTPKGWVKMKDICPGDEVCTPTGGTAFVVATFPQGTRPLFDVKLYDGRRVRVDGDHLWKVYSPSWNRRGKNGYKVMKTLDIVSNLERRSKNFKVYVPLSSRPAFKPNKELPIPPYILGALIGDGCLTGRPVQFTCATPALIDALNTELGTDDYSFKHRYGIQYHLAGNSYSPNKFKKLLRLMDLWGKRSQDKFIPVAYLEAGVNQRWDLLQGLVDTDGTVLTRRVLYTTASERLAKDVQYLAWSLGGMASIRSDGRGCFDVSIRGLDPRKCSRVKSSKIKVSGPPRYTPKNRIIAIDPVGEFDAKCIAIDSADGLYLTENYVVTHNTTAALAAVSSAQRLGNTVLWIDTEKTWDPTWASKCGVDPEGLIVADADSIEEIWQLVEKATDSIDEDERLLIVVDSATAVMSESQWSKDIGEEQRVGQDARVMRQALRKLNNRLARKNVTCIFINHAITKMVTFGKQSDSSGGHALKFWSSIRIEFAKIGEVTEGKGKDQVRRGQKVKIMPVKNKVMQTGRRSVEIELIETGFNLSEGLFDALIEIGAIERLNNVNYFFKPSETQLTRAEWPKFVEKQGGEGAMYKYFLRAARDNGFIHSYGMEEQERPSERETE